MALRFAILALFSFTLLGVNGPAGAADRCASLTYAEEECPPPPRVTYGPNLRVEVVKVERKLSFPRPKGGDTQVFDTSCSGGRCECDEEVEHLDFKGPVPGFAQVNAAEWRAAKALKCSVENSNVLRHVLRFSVTKAAVSTAAFELEYCHGCNGSCHGHAVLAAYDARTGEPVLLKDAIAPAQLGALKQRLATDFVTKNFEPAERAFGTTAVREDVAQITLENGLYIERGRAFVNIDTFALSCVSGPFHPVEIPAAFLTPAFRAWIRS